jgi:hypothetical protein
LLSKSTETQQNYAVRRASARRDPVSWARACGITLRPYQAQVAAAIKDSIVNRRGLSFVVVLPRQSGKNEVQRHLLAWLLYRAGQHGGSIVSVSPTFKPQTIDAMERVRLTLERNPATRGQWRASRGFIFRYGRTRLQFFSGEPTANVVGATADLLLNVDEAQDVEVAKFDKDFDPMTASTNATRVFWGTAWTSHTLLSRQMRIARAEQQADGIQRLFWFNAEDVRALVPAYAAHLERVIAEKGRAHPLVRTQYFCEELDAQTGMFPERRRALMGCGSPSPDCVEIGGGQGGGSEEQLSSGGATMPCDTTPTGPTGHLPLPPSTRDAEMRPNDPSGESTRGRIWGIAKHPERSERGPGGGTLARCPAFAQHRRAMSAHTNCENRPRRPNRDSGHNCAETH